ncbi:MAG: bacterial capsule synthesis cap family protein [Hyphomicrobiales bacterium]|nr:bacterial capsule synthesis cap family protein [Hyphomicrobiales bacterium]
MSLTLMLTGDVNLMNVDDPDIPFRRVRESFAAADLVFSNLECCLSDRINEGSTSVEGFFANPQVAQTALKRYGIDVVGLANNVNYGEQAINESIAHLDAAGIAHTGAGANAAKAYEPAVVTREGRRIAFVQRSSVFWATNHEATKHAAGIAVLRGHTAYQVPMYKMKREIPPLNRPGIPPYIVTWADKDHLARLEEDIKSARDNADIVIASFHWGLHKEVLDYMKEIAHRAIDMGADAVIGHGPHYSLGVEVYRGKPIFYGLGSFSFHTGHGGHEHGDWIGMAAKLVFDDRALTRASFEFVRHNHINETYVCDLSAETEELQDLVTRSHDLGARLVPEGNEVLVLGKDTRS